MFFSQYLRGRHRVFELYPIVLAIGTAWAIATALTLSGVFAAGHPAHVSADPLVSAPWLRVPYPLQWGVPVFGAAAAVGMLAGYVASMVESVGDYYACARLAGAPTPTASTVNRGIGMEGVGCLIAGLFGTGNGRLPIARTSGRSL